MAEAPPIERSDATGPVQTMSTLLTVREAPVTVPPMLKRVDPLKVMVVAEAGDTLTRRPVAAHVGPRYTTEVDSGALHEALEGVAVTVTLVAVPLHANTTECSVTVPPNVTVAMLIEEPTAPNAGPPEVNDNAAYVDVMVSLVQDAPSALQ